jgi:hypothetical protein
MWRNNNEDCKIVHSSSTALVLTFTKLGGNMVGITGALVGRIRETVTDPYGRWCGFTIIGRQLRNINTNSLQCITIQECDSRRRYVI